MNRLSSDVMFEEIHDSRAASDLLTKFSAPASNPEGFSLFAPLHYEPDYAYPLLIWLHGRGQNENQLRHVMPKISMRNYAAVAPRGTKAIAGESFSTDNQGFTWSSTEEHVISTLERIWEATEQAQRRFHTHPERIFLAGSGSGGTMALRIGMSMPERFCGVVSLGGALPTNNAPLSHLLSTRRLPLLLSVDRANADYPDSLVCANLRLLHIAGMTVTLRQYPAGNPLSDLMLSDIDRWIMETIADEQKAPQSSLAE